MTDLSRNENVSIFDRSGISDLQRESGYQKRLCAMRTRWRQSMTNCTLLGVATILSTALATPVLAQAVNSRTRRIRPLPSQRESRNCICATSATRRSCRWSRNCRRHGISTAFPFIDGRKRNYNQTLDSAGRPPPAACGRCPHIHVSIAVSRRCERRPQDQRHLPGLLNAASPYQTLLMTTDMGPPDTKGGSPSREHAR
jgi:hypothetical protein